MLATIAEHLSDPAALAVVGGILLRLLPLVSDRVNERAVRLAKAKKSK